jgi:hypothetical protein
MLLDFLKPFANKLMDFPVNEGRANRLAYHSISSSVKKISVQWDSTLNMTKLFESGRLPSG